MSDARINGDLRVTGDLQVNGSLPSFGRSDLTQDANAVFAVPMTEFRVWDNFAALLPGTSAADDLALVPGTFGTDAPKVTTGDVKATTITRYARLLFALPAEYHDGESVTVRLSAGMETTVSDGTATVDVEAYESDREGAVGSDLCTTAAQSINSTTLANKDFTVTPTGLASGDILDIRLTVAVADSATATAVIGTVGAVEMLVDIKG